MIGNIPFFASERFRHFSVAVLLCLLCSLVISACVTNTPTPTLAIPVPIINAPNGRCELAPGEALSLSVVGVSGSGVTYSWSASKGNVMPSHGQSVLYTAPDMGGDDIVRVEARMDGQSSAGVINCVVSTPVTLTPTIFPTPTATLTPTIKPTPTGWFPELKVIYHICKGLDGKIRVTISPTGGNGVYSYARSLEFEARIDDTKTLVVTSEDGQVWSETIHIDSDNVYPNCNSANSVSTAEPDKNGGDDGRDPPRPPY